LRALHGTAAVAGTTDMAVVAVTKVSSREGFVRSLFFTTELDCVATKMKTIDFILDGKFHLHPPQKRRV
jgi:hypothetical protein